MSVLMEQHDQCVDPRLNDAEMIRASYWQRKGMTLTEIAANLGTSKDRVVNSLYWDVVLPQRRRA